MEPQGSSEHKTSRPSSLVVQAADDAHPPQPHHPHHAHKDSRAVYMEIPHQAATPERDKPPSGRDKSATPARSLTSSISKDSLVLSPADSARERSADRDGDAGGRAAAETSSNPALSFTVDFGDERKPKLKSGASLSEFVPTKIRNSLSFHARSEKVSSSASSAKGREALGNRKNSVRERLFAASFGLFRVGVRARLRSSGREPLTLSFSPPPPPQSPSPSLISHLVTVDVKQHVYLLTVFLLFLKGSGELVEA